jgi:hypothetical protein
MAKKILIAVVIAVVLVGLLVGASIVSTYNELVTLREAVDNNWAQVDTMT